MYNFIFVFIFVCGDYLFYKVVDFCVIREVKFVFILFKFGIVFIYVFDVNCQVYVVCQRWVFFIFSFDFQKVMIMNFVVKCCVGIQFFVEIVNDKKVLVIFFEDVVFDCFIVFRVVINSSNIIEGCFYG